MDITPFLSHPKVSAIVDISDGEKQDLALVFIKAFDDGGNDFPIDFDDVWLFLEYSSKGNALQKLKRCFKEGTDFRRDVVRHHKNPSGADLGGRPTDKYFMTTKAFEFFALSALGDKGDRVRSFFLAVRDAWLDSATVHARPEEPNAMMLYQLEKGKLKVETERLRIENRRLEEEAPAKRIRFAHEWRSTLEGIGAFTVTDLMSFQGIVREAKNLTGLGHRASGPVPPALERAPVVKEYTLSEYLQLEHGKVFNSKQLQIPGKILAEKYRQIAGKEPGTKLVEVNGRATHVKAYRNEQIEGTDPDATGFDLMHRVAREHKFLGVFPSFNYKRIVHFTNWLNQVLGKERTVIPHDVIDAVKAEFRKADMTSVDEITPQKVRGYLKKLNLSQYYEHSVSICRSLGGAAEPEIDTEMKEKIIFMFSAVQEPFQKNKPPGRASFLSYAFCLYKFCQLLKIDQMLVHVPLVKSRVKLRVYDGIWERIWQDLSWHFIPTDT
ncbi:hypothetical protein KFL_014610020 [Klebsormidium nitens]|uniref:Uncharacterized protein n=1 Tax=Klebsormidium nitens TaxID=105231 RepID=A0A1Y1IUQ3_KLENI|nr:hypothetical protein KFL_014610020 [Klebsormidium nitens]|eukprot:GAQ93349.1 hypothetical protein KFL_014610020 [Klebsormidium nitens]